ncbi:MAG: ABC transporter permease [Bacteroidetes bacterium]|nr:ABC transporter permease [Bacteroidota bacterium]MBV6460922.1 putative phospholipid ABC transporter permease protein MlaE [Flavobacteriales bacterium]WKZ75681.1 MAG: ABC transporter permease [Vicingaceae bacterium]MCL4815247.1 ABC transporter permease [Flavobacteriales bacterium]NOG94589.1 ABC transporter permease [Bacteroidota bacterium]
MNIVFHFGRYFIMMYRVFSKPEKFGIYRENTFKEMISLGIGSMGIVAIISLFMGAVITIQTASNIDSPWIPSYTVGFTTRQSVILEFSPTIIALILAGKIGSNIASEIGTMRVTEQIDALEIMGINSASYLTLPKIIAALFINPFIIIYSMFLGMFGGWIVAVSTGIVTSNQYIYGLQYDFKPFDITYALIKTVVFAFVITSIPAYHGYYTRGGALEVGRSSTRAVVYSSIAILVVNYLLTQLLLI